MEDKTIFSMETYQEEFPREIDQYHILHIFKQVKKYFSKQMAWHHNMNLHGLEKMPSFPSEQLVKSF